MSISALSWLVARLLVALYLVASALARYDRGPLSIVWVAVRLALALGVLAKPETYHLTALALAAGVLVWHAIGHRDVSRDARA